MHSYIGTKIVNAKPMSKHSVSTIKEIPTNDNEKDEEGYLVEYTDGGQANTPDYSGYVSWSPKDVFEKAYKASGELSFGAALEMLKLGKKVARSGWNGKGMYLILAEEGSFYRVDQETDAETGTDPFIVMYTAGGTFQPGWLASQADMLISDWCIVDA